MNNIENTIYEIMVYINLNLFEHITLDVLSNRFSYSKYHLHRKFKDIVGITLNDYIKKRRDVYRKYLKKYKAEIVYGDIDKMSEVIKNSLQSNIPLHFQYLTANLMGDGKPVLHYSALIGYDDAEETYSIADPFGSIKKLKKEVFFDAVSFRNECLPDIIKQKYPSNMMIKFTLC
ncbi:MAG TPA: hypothetical protein VHT96_02170 [Clostridia bacterium]|nr:hypothetical protein [Clostridia bacterium]